MGGTDFEKPGARPEILQFFIRSTGPMELNDWCEARSVRFCERR